MSKVFSLIIQSRAREREWGKYLDRDLCVGLCWLIVYVCYIVIEREKRGFCVCRCLYRETMCVREWESERGGKKRDKWRLIVGLREKEREINCECVYEREIKSLTKKERLSVIEREMGIKSETRCDWVRERANKWESAIHLLFCWWSINGSIRRRVE